MTPENGLSYLHIPCQHIGLPNSFRKCGLRSWHLLRKRRPRANCIAKRVFHKFLHLYILCVNMIMYVWKKHIYIYTHFRFRFICSLIFVLQYPTCIVLRVYMIMYVYVYVHTYVYIMISICMCICICIYIYIDIWWYMCLRIQYTYTYVLHAYLLQCV